MLPDATIVLLQKALDGDGSARNALLNRLRPRIVLWAASRMSARLRSKLEPEDLAQEIMLAVHSSLDDFELRDERAFTAWLFRVAENRVRDAADHFGARKRQTDRPPAPTQASPSSIVAREEATERVRDAITRLPEDYRRVIQLRRLEDRDTGDVAEQMERSENAVRVLYCRALKALRAELGEQA